MGNFGDIKRQSGVDIQCILYILICMTSSHFSEKFVFDGFWQGNLCIAAIIKYFGAEYFRKDDATDYLN